MNLDLDERTLTFQQEVRSWLAKHVPPTPLPSLDTTEGFAAHRQWEKKLAQDQLSVVSWPTELGGRGCSILEWVIFEEEYYAAGAPTRVSQNGIFLLAPTLFSHGTIEQRSRILPKMATGQEIWAQAWSEPGAGSDLAGIKSTAQRVTGGWLLNGQKTWSSRASFA
ncbi:MAG: acyl-CoA dehydrogenase family protein, partial [Mycobacteriaceae bacterium]